jgi:uncharacterized protein with GYD domain
MPVYMFQESYTNDAWAVQIKDPQNRMDVARKIIEAQGGKLLSAYYAFGDYDVILIAEFPDNVSAAAMPSRLRPVERRRHSRPPCCCRSMRCLKQCVVPAVLRIGHQGAK